MREAKKAIREAQPRLLRLVGMGAVAEKSEGILEFPITCHSGGTMDVYIEAVLPKPQLILLGNSPVAQTLAKLADVLDFEVDVFDPNSTLEQFPNAHQIAHEHNLEALTIRPLSFVVVSTQGHDDELRRGEAAARAPRPVYIACVSSKRKFAGRAEFCVKRHHR